MNQEELILRIWFRIAVLDSLELNQKERTSERTRIDDES